MAGQMENSWQIREMAPDEVGRIDEIDVSETGDVLYKCIDGKVVGAPVSWTRSADHGGEWPELAEWTREQLLSGGVAYGAFADEKLVGFIALKHRLSGEMALLAALWVSRAFRQRGIASALTARIVADAVASGATALYVSGAPTESAYGFYRSQGFAPAEFVHLELFQREPEDIHMVKPL